MNCWAFVRSPVNFSGMAPMIFASAAMGTGFGRYPCCCASGPPGPPGPPGTPGPPGGPPGPPAFIRRIAAFNASIISCGSHGVGGDGGLGLALPLGGLLSCRVVFFVMVCVVMMLTCLENGAALIALFVWSSSVDDSSAVLLPVAVDDSLDSWNSALVAWTASRYVVNVSNDSGVKLGSSNWWMSLLIPPRVMLLVLLCGMISCHTP